LSVSLGDERFQRGNGVHRLGQNFIAFLTLGGFPPHSSPHLLSALTRKTYEFRWVTRWIGMARAGAQALMAAREEKALGGAGYMKDYLVKKLLKEPEGAGGKRVNRLATKMAEQAGRAQESLTDRGYGMQTTTFILWEKDFHKFQRNVSDLKATLQDHGLIVREEHVEPVKVWRMSLPGVRDAGRRTYPVSSRSCVDISAFDEVWTGRGFDHHLAKVTGVHRSWMRTADPVPHSIDTDAPGGAAHAVLFGRTGQAAKSTFANHLGLQFGWPGSQIISISVGRSELGPVLLSGGVVYKLGDHNSPNRLQPLLRADAPEGALQASEWLQLCIEEQGLQATPDRVEKLDKAVALRGADAPQRRTMTELVGNLHSLDPALAQALLPYTSGNAYGHIFDGNSGAELERKPWTMFDISQLIDLRPAAVVPAVAAITNITRGWFAVGRPTLVMLDECQFYLRYERARVAVQRILDTDRKNCVRVLLITQTPAHLCAFPDLLPSIRSACDTVFYGPDPKANESAEDYAKFGVGEAELRAISELPLGSYLQRNQFGSRAFALNPSDIALTLTGLSSPTELALLEQLHAECEGDSDKMLMRLLETQSTRNNDMAAKARKLLGWIDAEKKSA
jgi:type IV secretory pathway VirB4 component